MDRIKNVECFKLAIPRDTPYLGKLNEGETVNSKGCFVRKGNSSIYSVNDNSLLVRITCESGAYGWGECVTVVAPQVAEAVVEQILGPIVIGRSPMNAVEIYEDLYNSMRVRGFFGGFFMDAVAAIDMAIWDLKGKLLRLPVYELLGSGRHKKLKAYVSGLPAPTRRERADLAKSFMDKGFDAVKVPIIVDVEHPAEEMESLRQAVGGQAKLLVDMHWRYTAQEAIQLIHRMNQYDLYLAEAPVHPEDMEGQAQVTATVGLHVGIGEELRTVYEYLPRFQARCMDVIQPEMGRMGITAFWNVCQMSLAYHKLVMPHASIGIGIFQAASLQVSAAVENCMMHEYQHSIFNKNLQYIRGNMRCEQGYYYLPEGPGLGVEPTAEVLEKYTI